MTNTLARTFELLLELEEEGVWIGTDGRHVNVVQPTSRPVSVRLWSRIVAMNDILLKDLRLMTHEEERWLTQLTRASEIRDKSSS